MTEWVEWVEPFVETDTGTEPVYLRVSVKAAIARAKFVACEMNHEYASNQEALEDFIAVHWATGRTSPYGKRTMPAQDQIKVSEIRARLEGFPCLQQFVDYLSQQMLFMPFDGRYAALLRELNEVSK
jgi:hypothetical protein